MNIRYSENNARQSKKVYYACGERAIILANVSPGEQAYNAETRVSL